MHPRWASHGRRARAQSEGEASGVVQHQNPIVIVLGRPRAKPKVGLVEASRACLIRHRDCQVVHPRYGTAPGRAANAGSESRTSRGPTSSVYLASRKPGRRHRSLERLLFASVLGIQPRPRRRRTQHRDRVLRDGPVVAKTPVAAGVERRLDRRRYVARRGPRAAVPPAWAVARRQAAATAGRLPWLPFNGPRSSWRMIASISVTVPRQPAHKATSRSRRLSRRGTSRVIAFASAGAPAAL